MRVFSHPTRLAILMDMNTPPTRLSPVRFARDRRLDTNRVAYHFRMLEKAGCIELVDRQPVRGSYEHFYEPIRTALAWQGEWEQFGPVVKQTLAASVLGGGVEAIGKAIDDGTFEARPNSHLSWHTMRLDEAAWAKAGEVMDRALSELMELEAESVQRSDASDLFLGSFLMSLFESPPKH
jgi:hypothetical protein